jgi:hypothetical protein
MSVSLKEPGVMTSQQYVRGFASRLCLILERFIKIADYEVESPKPLEEAIAFIKRAQGIPVQLKGAWDFDPSVVNTELLSTVVHRMAYKGYIAEGTTVRDFTGFAESTLRGLIDKPRKVSPKAMQQVSDFFCTIETIIDQIMGS